MSEVDWKPDWNVTTRVGGSGSANAAHRGDAVSQLPEASRLRSSMLLVNVV